MFVLNCKQKQWTQKKLLLWIQLRIAILEALWLKLCLPTHHYTLKSHLGAHLSQSGVYYYCSWRTSSSDCSPLFANISQTFLRISKLFANDCKRSPTVLANLNVPPVSLKHINTHTHSLLISLFFMHTNRSSCHMSVAFFCLTNYPDTEMQTRK